MKLTNISRGTGLVTATIAALLATTITQLQAAPPFHTGSFWNTPIQNEASSSSQTDRDNLVAQAAAHGVSLNYDTYSVPVWIGSGIPTADRIDIVDSNDGQLTPIWQDVPWPSNATWAVGTDRHAVVWDRTLNKIWEFYHCGGTFPNITAEHGDRYDSATQHSGVSNGYRGATATGLAAIGGLITWEEGFAIAANPDTYVIPHVLAISVNGTTDTHVGPAIRHDHWPYDPVENPGPTGKEITEGRRFKLSASYVIPSAFPPLLKAICRTAKEYGIVVRDHGPAVKFYAQAPAAGVPHPWNSSTWGTYNNQTVLDQFPFSQLYQLNPMPGHLLNGAIYEIEPVCAATKRIAVTSASTLNNASVEVNSDLSTSNQRWKLISKGGAVFELEPQHTPKRLHGAGSTSGSYAQIYSVLNTTNQQWRILEPTPDSGEYQLVPQHATGLRLHVEGTGAVLNGTKLQIVTANSSSDRQRFRFHKQ